MNKNKTLLQKFIEFNAQKRMANAHKRTLLAVSGGMDSVVMCHLYHKAGFPFGIAHCNFKLRGEESDADEKFVLELGKKYGIKVFIKTFETEKYATQKNISIQVAARELRYQWFEELRNKEKYRLIATAHQLNDNIETIFYNLIKGTGIRGLRGIPVRQGNIIRPMLFASREEIENYLKSEKLTFREDSSNQSDKYTRNKIRHHLIPLMKEINPSLEVTLSEKIELFTQLEHLYEKQTGKNSNQLFLKRASDIYIPIAKLKKTSNAADVLYEFLKDYGFNGEQVQDMLATINETAGKQFISSKARVIKDRRFFILTHLPEKDFTIKLIEEKDSEVKLDSASLKITGVSNPKITADTSTAFIDKSKLLFPLTIRRWKAGDYFYPIGMGMKKKKVKKFLTDEKVPLHQKENCWVIESGERIVWLVGYRLDERFKVTESTKDVVKMKLS